ncbi:MAG: alpha/beta hydrolase family protein [Gemmataceae bacterium]
MNHSNVYSDLSRICAVLLFLLPGSTCISAQEKTKYDPLQIPKSYVPPTKDLTVEDKKRSRKIPVKVYLPQQKQTAPVVLFSHGLGGSRDGCRYLGQHWAKRGYVAVFVQHPGSDESVWKNVPARQRMTALRKAANSKNYWLRVKDIPAVLDQLQNWNASKDHTLAGRLDMKRIGMSGHSFGAVTTQAVSGQSAMGGRISFADPRIKAAIAFSPSSPRRGDPKDAFSRVKIPWLLMTGTKDLAVIGGADVKSRLAVFPALPVGSKYELVLDKAEHSAFTERRSPGDKEKRNPNHHRAVLALSTAFWDAYLRDDKAARVWLDGKGPRTILQAKDRWRKK